MYFYKIEAKMSYPCEPRDGGEQRNLALSLQAKLTGFPHKNDGGQIFIASINGDSLTMGAIARDTAWLGKTIQRFLAAAEIECSETTYEEIAFKSFRSLLSMSERSDYINDDDEVAERFGIDPLFNHCYLNYSEHMLAELPSKEELINKATQMLCVGTIIPELERIYQPPKKVVAGHPVHYLIQNDHSAVGDGIYGILLTALFINNRLSNRRYCVIDVTHDSDINEKECQALYEICSGGTVVFKCNGNTGADLGDKSEDIDWLDTACRAAVKYREKTLTVFNLPRAAEKLKKEMLEQLGIMTLVELAEDPVSGDRAKAFLKQTARKRGVSPDKSLYKTIDDDSKKYTTSELLSSFDLWHSNRLKTFYYPQYASFESSGKTAAKTKPKGTAYSELEQLIGLHEAKAVIKQAIDYFKAQKIFRDRGLKSDRPSMHMVFSGAPGTAKTTVARLFARIMRENGLLSVGSLYEVGRADLVGKYVGWTARIVEKKFRDAMGSVLFIDEAYSLVDDRDGLYGDEAINTIVAEMENRREDIVVIFAGYSEKMEQFLQRNPGLRSRIAFHVPFADYVPEELLNILALIADKQSMKLDCGVRDKLLPILATASMNPDFGNGRFMRNLFEKARMKQAGRLLAMDIDSLTTEQVTQLIADDFDAPARAGKLVHRIGF